MNAKIINPRSARISAELSSRHTGPKLRSTQSATRKIWRQPGVALGVTRNPIGFTLIELLVVIAIMSILAAMIFPVTGAINRRKIRSKAQAELGLLQMAIENYKTALGHFPPDNPLDRRINALYFELKGTRLTNGFYQTLDGSARIRASSISNNFPNGFGPAVGGVANCSQGPSSDEARTAGSFLPGLKSDQMAGWNNGQDMFKVIACPVPGPPIYPGSSPLAGQNLFGYNSSNPTNNPGSFDLFVDVVIGGKMYRVGNWSREPILITNPNW